GSRPHHRPAAAAHRPGGRDGGAHAPPHRREPQPAAAAGAAHARTRQPGREERTGPRARGGHDRPPEIAGAAHM
ncbi:MAG: FIG019278: hypothetical protein, partial [uncultured Lysobacter sp.]